MFILSYEAAFYKPTVLKVYPPISGITAHATMPGWLEVPTWNIPLSLFAPGF
jgi:hypothetical protein